jgi:hypothetical protein
MDELLDWLDAAYADPATPADVRTKITAYLAASSPLDLRQLAARCTRLARIADQLHVDPPLGSPADYDRLAQLCHWRLATLARTEEETDVALERGAERELADRARSARVPGGTQPGRAAPAHVES